MNNMDRRRDALRSSCQLVVESLESRRLLCGLPHEQLIEAPQWNPILERHAQADAAAGDSVSFIWSNRGQTSDGFASTFGANANAARAVIDALLADWGRAITSFNRADGTTSMQLNISMNTSGTGFSAAGGPASSNIPADGKPRTGSLTIGRGNDTSGDGIGDGSGWFLDPTPSNFEEYMGNITHAFTGAPTTSTSSFDLYTVAGLELTHALGLITGTGYNSYKLATSGYLSTTSTPDTAEAGSGNTGSKGYYAIFNGPSVKHLMTTNNGGSGGSDWGSPIHTAGSAGNLTIGTVNYRGSEDTGNAVYDQSRLLPNEVMLRILGDAYGYSIVDPKTLPNFFAVLNPTSRVLTVRGLTGSSGSSDTIDISQSGTKIRISVDIGNDSPGSGELPGAGNLGAYVSEFDASTVDSIVINAGDGSDFITVSAVKPMTINGGAGGDTIRVERTYAGTPLTINGEADNDSIYAGRNNNLDELNGNFTVSGGGGTDKLWIEDLFNSYGDTHTLTANTYTRSAMGGVLTFDTSLEGVNVQAGSGANNINVRAGAVPVTVNGGSGNDTFAVGNAASSLDDIDSSINIVGDAGTDAVNFNDQGNGNPWVFTLTSNSVARTGGMTGTVTWNAEAMTLNSGGADDIYHLGSTGNNATYRINGNGGNDRLYFGRTAADDRLDPLDGAVTFDGGTGTFDEAHFWNQDGSGGTYTVSSTSVSASGIATATLIGVEVQELIGSSAADRYDVTPATTTEFLVDGRGGTDTLNVITAGTTSPQNNPSTTAGSGTYTFGNRMTISYVNTESVITNGVAPNQLPLISSISAAPNPVTPNGSFTVTASGVSDPDGSVLAVYFYRENNGVSGFQSDDLLIGADASSSGGWSMNATAPGAAGTYTLYARVADNSSAFSSVVFTALTVQAANNVPPTIASFTVAPSSVVAGNTVRITANGVADFDGQVQSVTFYHETNGVAGLQISIGAGGDTIVTSDTTAADGWYADVNTTGFVAGSHAFYAIARDDGGLNSSYASNSITVTAPAGPIPYYSTTFFDLPPARFLFMFLDDVGASINPTDLVVTNRRTGATVSVADATWDAANRGLVFSLSTLPPDGDYRATLSGSGIYDTSGIPMGADVNVDFFVYRGDANGDRTVNFDDLLILARNYGQLNRSYKQGNFSYDLEGRVDFNDLLILAKAYGKTLAGAAPLAEPVVAIAGRKRATTAADVVG